MSLQQENEAAVAALAAARDELERANAQLAELDELRAERARDARAPRTRSRLGRRSCRTSWRAGPHGSTSWSLVSPSTRRPASRLSPSQPEPTYDDDNHVLLVPSETGFVTLERPGPAPQPGDTVGLPIGRYKVSRRGASPFPADTRGCAYLIQA